MTEIKPAKPVCVMVVDDEKVIRDLLRRHLNSLGYDVVIAESGEMALVRAKHFRPSLVILDIKMPGMGGLKCLKQLRKLDPDLPVIMLTAVLERDAVMEAVHDGALEYLYKPIDLSTITKVVQTFLAAR